MENLNELKSQDQFDEILCEAILRAFKYVDDKIKRNFEDGTTAVSLFMGKQVDGSTRILCPWVGDSRCVLFHSNTPSGEIKAIQMTEDHIPSLLRESNRIILKSGVVWTGSPREMYYNQKHPSEIDFQLDDSTASEATFISIDSKENKMNGQNENKSFHKYGHCKEHKIIHYINDSDNMIQKRQVHSCSFIEKRGKNKTGPMAVFGRYGMSLSVTRSLGDIHGPRSCSWVPDISAITIPAGHPARFVLASDGFWDVLSIEAVKSLVYSYKSVDKVAALLTKRAWLKRTHLSMHIDDITVVVVDVNQEFCRANSVDNTACSGIPSFF
eukprot:CAMPEP_0182436936 /NCGR_PEP_ID=MMETSP1167-20130531/84537_1 /TAXON_ID=2988 /ORGANISM="Mallomonas Sp, Strain CCMP3275" /LENGTH=325 /DNA_ID=CAMNT_0024629643 /DNA_START=173 /DNA_END=1150 /DNA_ORIENTATION=+